MNQLRVKFLWYSFANLFLLPLFAAGASVLVPLWFAGQGEKTFYPTMAAVGCCTWLILTAFLFLTHRWFYGLAAGMAASSVLLVWGIHVLLAHDYFRLYVGVPGPLAFFGAATWWGSYFTILFWGVYAYHLLQTQGTGVVDKASHPGRSVAYLILLQNLFLAITIFFVSAFPESKWFAFWGMANLHLPLQTIKDAARAGMGAGGYFMGSIFLYLVLGTAFQAGLGWFVCRVGYSLRLVR